MSYKFQPGQKFPHTIYLGSSPPSKHTWDDLADWCSVLIGQIDMLWIVGWDESNGMAWQFKRKDDSSLFKYTWQN